MDFLFFFISYTRKERENPEVIDFVIPENDKEKPECIYSFENFENDKYNYWKVFKAVNKSKSLKEEEIKYYFEFEIEGDKYIISFKCQRNVYFIYDVNLKWGKADISIRRKINQDKIVISKN